MWKRAQGDLLRPPEYQWHPGRSREAGGRLGGVGDGGGPGRHLPLLGLLGRCGGGYRAGRAVPVACRVVFAELGAARGRGNVAVKDRFEVTSFGAGWIGAGVLGFGMGASAEGAYSWVLTGGLTWPNLEQLLHCLEGDEG